MKEQKKDEGVTGDSDLFTAVRLLEDNGFYVVHADSGQHNYSETGVRKDYPGALLIQAYPKRTTRVEHYPDRFEYP